MRVPPFAAFADPRTRDAQNGPDRAEGHPRGAKPASFATAVRVSSPPRSCRPRWVTSSLDLRHSVDVAESSLHVRGRRPQRPLRNGRPGEQTSDPAAPQPPPGFAVPPFAPEGYDAALEGLVPSRPVIIPPDPQGVLQNNHAAREILAHDSLVIVRQLEMMNVFLGFEQANRYAIHAPSVRCSSLAHGQR